MNNSVSITRTCLRRGALCVLALAVVLSVFFLNGSASAAAAQQKVFQSPEEAVKAMEEALKAPHEGQLIAILGPGSKNLVRSGDQVADREMRDRFMKAFAEGYKIQTVSENKAILVIGSKDWPFPLPIIKEGQTWRFDAKEGVREILNRRIGRNEMSAIQVCLAYVDAQREYALREQDKKGILEYARKFMSDPGKKNGLYWESEEGESPMGPMAAYAESEGYKLKAAGKRPFPYHGYFFRIIDAQGSHAPGGAYSYMAGGKMIGGFALIAYPARYGNSGVMSFMVNHNGVVYQKNLGPNTARIAAKITAFNPDSTWTKAE